MSKNTSPAAIRIGVRGITVTEKGLSKLVELTDARASATASRTGFVQAVRDLAREANNGLQLRITMMRIVGDWKVADRQEAANRRSAEREKFDWIMYDARPLFW